MTSPALERSDPDTTDGLGEASALALLWLVPAVALVLALLGVG